MKVVGEPRARWAGPRSQQADTGPAPSPPSLHAATEPSAAESGRGSERQRASEGERGGTDRQINGGAAESGGWQREIPNDFWNPLLHAAFATRLLHAAFATSGQALRHSAMIRRGSEYPYFRCPYRLSLLYPAPVSSCTSML